MGIKHTIVGILEKGYEVKYNLSKKDEITDYEKEFKKIALIVTKPLGIGDLIMMTPVIKSFRINFPKSKIDLITNHDIFDKLDEVNNIIIVKGSNKDLIKEFKQLSSNNYNLGVILARAINQSIYLDKLSPKYKLGFISSKKIDSNFKLVRNDLVFENDVHFTENSLKIIDSLGMKKYYDLVEPKFSKEIIKNVKDYFSSLNLDKNKKTIAIVPYVLWESRRWSEYNFIKLIKKLHANYNIVLYGGPDAVELNSKIIDKLGNDNVEIIDTTGKLKLKESLYFLKLCDMVVCNDSGPMHFSTIMKTPTVAFFGPVKPNHRLPMKNDSLFYGFWLGEYRKNIKMYDYNKELVDKSMDGLKEIPVYDVYNKIIKFFKDKRF